MKRLFSIILAATMVTVTGCKLFETTTPERLQELMFCSGISAGAVVNTFITDPASKSELLNIVDLVSDTIPESTSTVKATWMPLIEHHLEMLLNTGKITDDQLKKYTSAAEKVCTAADHYIKKYPEAARNREETAEAIKAFVYGFTTVVKTINKYNPAPAEACADPEVIEAITQE